MTSMPLDNSSAVERVMLAVQSDDTDEALRVATMAVSSAPASHDPPLVAALWLLELLGGGEGQAVAHALCLRDALALAGDLPHALIAAELAASWQSAAPAGAPAPVGEVAALFGKGSRHLVEPAVVPPALPKAPPPVAKALQTAKGQALQEHARKALAQCVAALGDTTRLPPDTEVQVPRQLLFSALPAGPLERLLSRFERQELAAGELLFQQGAEGQNLFLVVDGRLEAVQQGEAASEKRLATLGSGALVGEMALLSATPRAASVRAIGPCRVLALSRTALAAEATHDPSISDELARFCHKRMLANLMDHSALLAPLSGAEKRDLLRQFTARAVPEGDVLVREGQDSPGLFLVASGLVRVSRDDQGDELVIAELGPGEVVGEVSLVLRKQVTATVTAIRPTVALFLPAQAFQGVVAAHPGLLQQLYGLAVDREEELHSVVAQEAVDVGQFTLL